MHKPGHKRFSHEPSGGRPRFVLQAVSHRPGSFDVFHRFIKRSLTRLKSIQQCACISHASPRAPGGVSATAIITVQNARLLKRRTTIRGFRLKTGTTCSVHFPRFHRYVRKPYASATKAIGSTNRSAFLGGRFACGAVWNCRFPILARVQTALQLRLG